MGIQDRDWYRADRPDDRRQPVPREQAWTSHPLAIVLAVVVGAFVVWAIQVTIVEWRARVAVEQIMQAGNEAMRQSQIQVQRIQREAAEREERRQAALRQQEAIKTQAIVRQQQGIDEARRLAAAEGARKEKAWANFYRKPAHCNENATVECANDYIRAKRLFEEKYAQGGP